MSTYQIAFHQTATAYVEVEADTLTEAIDKACELTPGSLCHQCASGYDMSGDWEPVEDTYMLNGEWVESEA